MTTKQISNRLVALCRAGRNIEAVDKLLGSNVVSVEAKGDKTMPAVMSGRAAVRAKNEWWVKNHKVHSAEVKGPFPNGDRFAVIFNYVVSPLAGPMAGKKVQMEEVALYTIKRGKIVREDFFYDMSGASNPQAKKKARKTAPKAKAKLKPKAKPRTRSSRR